MECRGIEVVIIKEMIVDGVLSVVVRASRARIGVGSGCENVDHNRSARGGDAGLEMQRPLRNERRLRGCAQQA